MIFYSDQILYACVSKRTTVLADLCSGDPDLEALASQCLEKTPEFHGFYSHTLRKRMYCFLIDNPLIYFAVVDEDLGKPQVLQFLNHLRDAFSAIDKKKGLDSFDEWTYRCFQEDFDSVFSSLVQRRNSINVGETDADARKSISTEAPLLANQERWYDDDAMEDVALDSEATRELRRELSWEIRQEISRRISMKKMSQKTSGNMSPMMSRKIMSNRQASGLRQPEEPRERSQEEEVSLSMRMGSFCMGNESLRQSAWRSWKRQVFIALVVDFLLCSILLGVWLAVCNGFRCTKN